MFFNEEPFADALGKKSRRVSIDSCRLIDGSSTLVSKGRSSVVGSASIGTTASEEAGASWSCLVFFTYKSCYATYTYK